MSRPPIIERQRALSTVGEVRLGGEKQNGRVGRKLETFRLTSQQRDLIERAAQRYGGVVKPWESPSGPSWQVITERAALPVLVVVGYSLTLLYEKWEGATKCTRRCDGEHEMLSDSPCICSITGEDECDIITRFMVVLPELGTSLGWKLRSTGERAADELNGGMAIATELARGRTFMPAQLRLTQRRGTKDGQVVRYVVPVLDFDPAQALLGAPVEGELAAVGYTPLPPSPNNSPSLGEALEEVESRQVTRTGRSAAPFPDVETTFTTAPTPTDDVPFGEGPPPVIEGQEALPVEEPAPARKPTRRMNTLVGKFRSADHDPTEFLWELIASHRLTDPDALVGLLDGRDEEGVLHWSPLRDSLTVEESMLVVRELEKFEAVIEGRA